MALAQQTIQIEAKRKDVMADLALVEPAVIDAQQGRTPTIALNYTHVCYRHYSSFTPFKLIDI